MRRSEAQKRARDRATGLSRPTSSSAVVMDAPPAESERARAAPELCPA